MFEVVEAVRKGTPPLIGLWGPSGSGKTYSALLMARGIVGENGKIVVIDTENGRALFYAKVAGGWHHIDFQPPFTPARYMEAMAAAEQAGADAIIIDSMSHSWEGQGGVLEMADQGRSASGKPFTGLKKFQAPKMEFKRMTNSILRSRVPVIFCLRSKDLNVQVGAGPNAQIVSKGMVPICEKNFIFEMTVSLLLGPDHKPVFENTEELKCSPTVPSVKVPEELNPAIKRGEPVSIQTGAMIAEWVGGGEAVDPEIEKTKQFARTKAMEGSIAFRDWWSTRTREENAPLRSILEDLKSLATEADRAAAEASRSEYDDDFERDESDPLSDEFTGEAA